MRATGTIDVKSWDEKPYDETDGEPRLARAEVKLAFAGDVDGQSSLVYLMVYGDGGLTSAVGLERVVGRLGGRTGSFVLEHRCTHQDAAVHGSWSVVPGTGTGDLSGLRGAGSYVWDGPHGTPGRYMLDYELDPPARGGQQG